ELLTGRVPFEGTDPMTIITSHLTAPPPPATSLRSNLPKWVDLVLDRALAKRPEDRYPSVEAFGNALQSAGGSARTTVNLQATAAAGAPSGLLATYELGDRIGSGRLGSDVYAGVHRVLGHAVAIRILRRGPERNWDAVRARFLREARTLQVAHPSVIQVRDYGEEGDLVYLVTDFIAGPSLRELLTAEGALPWPRLRPLLVQLTDAARALHRRGGLLCGTSPEIIRITRDDDEERLMMSTAGIWRAQDLLSTMKDQTLRGTALLDVELRYVAPELLTGRDGDVRADIFTLGVLAYEMAAGQPPYDAPTMPALLGVMLRGNPADLRSVQPTLPESAAAAIVRALQPDPAARFATARELAQALGG
ncbi:MAG TPA: serine/threonine-protein kinase, partial [Vicinamibacterales bacterium]|nr:serine/threonine-protein kinase [Vicinamibacterales bacterium]